MRQRRLLLVAVAILLLISFAAGMYLSSSRLRDEEATPQKEAIPLENLLSASFTDPAGRTTTLAHLKGKPLIVNFWATWCPPCLKEMPVLSGLHEKYPDVQIVGIAADTPDNVRRFIADGKPAYPILVADGSVMALMAELGNHRNGLPFTITIDAAGHPRHSKLGALTETEAEKIIADLGKN